MKTPFQFYGIECGPGWKSLYIPLMGRCMNEGAVIVQIKEKFGGLRFYAVGCSDETKEAIRAAEQKSLTMCEVCGDVGTRRKGSWLKTLCDEDAKART
jgi:hypothetical protein